MFAPKLYIYIIKQLLITKLKKKPKLLTVDILALVSMKNAAKCDN